MTGGKSPIGYLKAYLTNLYLSRDSKKVTEAIEEGKMSSLSKRLKEKTKRVNLEPVQPSAERKSQSSPAAEYLEP